MSAANGMPFKTYQKGQKRRAKRMLLAIEQYNALMAIGKGKKRKARPKRVTKK